MWTMNIDSYADFKTALAALGEPSSVFYRYINSGAGLTLWAISGDAIVGSGNINSPSPPSEPDLLTDFPSAHLMTNSFSPAA